MTNLLARAYVMNRMDDDQVRSLHSQEVRLGYFLPAGAIHDQFRTKPWGEISEEAQRDVGGPVHGIYHKIRGEHEARARLGGEYSDIAIVHSADWLIRSQGVTFHGGKGGSSLHERVMGGRAAAMGE